ncbi:MAG: hypothetical protein D6B27_12205 [Gammaproteobacteria bacterium]|nr:MAG: hypothetical protein D6B27_12205 [Gammaproteobacteria bacterium]
MRTRAHGRLALILTDTKINNNIISEVNEMALLDELKQEANKRKLSEEARAKEIEQREQYYRNDILPKLIRVFNYLDELVKAIIYLQREITVSYQITGVGELQGLLQDNYKVSVDSTQAMKRVALSFVCDKDEDLEFEVKGEKLIEQQVSFLLSHKLEFDQKKKRNLRSNVTESVFKLKKRVPVSIAMEADIDNSQIILKIHNFSSLGLIQRTLEVDEITDEYLDRLGRYIMRQDQSFITNELSEEALKSIRDKLRREEKQRAKELGMRVQQLREERIKQDQGVLDKARGRLGA